MNKSHTHIINEIALVFQTNIHHMNSYEHCTEIELREKLKKKMNIALKKKPVKKVFVVVVWNDHGKNLNYID